MAPDTQTIDYDTTCNAQGLVLAVPFGNSISHPEFERTVAETISAAIKRVDLDDDDDEEDDEDVFDEEGEEQGEFEDEDDDEEDDDDDEDVEDGDEDEDDEEGEDDGVEPLSVKWRRAR